MAVEVDDGRLIWMDLEMSGLDPERDRVLEIAVLVTDAELELVAEGPDLVLHQPEAVLAGMDEWNRTHHGDSGLVERVRAARLDEAGAAEQVL
ncbi:MAG TPA: oligoribonuclease, partial [Planctomycetota bacterium]